MAGSRIYRMCKGFGRIDFQDFQDWAQKSFKSFKFEGNQASVFCGARGEKF